MRPLSDRSSLFLRAFYFCYFAAGASLLPFLVLYYQQLSLPGFQIGLLSAIPPLTFLVAAPVWGGLAHADRTAPSGMGATTQAIFSGVSMGLAAAVGAFLGGLLYERLGLAALFGWGAAGLLLILALLAVLNLAFGRPRHG